MTINMAFIILFICFLLGVLITIAEPDLTVLSKQLKDVVNPTKLIVFVGIGVAIFLVFGVLKIMFKRQLASLLMFFYMLLFALSSILILNGNNSLLSFAFDSGGVTTGPITVPFIMALGLGISTTIGGKRANENSFGLISLCSVGPILAVIILGIFATGTIDYQVPSYEISNNVVKEFFVSLLSVAKENNVKSSVADLLQNDNGYLAMNADNSTLVVRVNF